MKETGKYYLYSGSTSCLGEDRGGRLSAPGGGAVQPKRSANPSMIRSRSGLRGAEPISTVGGEVVREVGD